MRSSQPALILGAARRACTERPPESVREPRSKFRVTAKNTARLLEACDDAVKERERLEAEAKAKRTADAKKAEFKKLLWEKFRIAYTEPGATEAQ